VSISGNVHRANRAEAVGIGIEDEWGLVGQALAYHALGRKKQSEAALAELINKYGSSAAPS
jgi:hypothetical protein